MKAITGILFVTLLSTPVFASEGVDHIVERVQQQIETLAKTRAHATVTNGGSAEIPWSTIEKRDSAFWTATIEAYDFLKVLGLRERYNFIYEATKAISNENSHKAESLKTWINQENKNIGGLIIHPKYVTTWKNHVAKINSAIDLIASPRPEVQINAPEIRPNKIHQQMIAGIQHDLKTIRTALKKEQALNAARTKKEIRTAEAKDENNYSLLIAGCVASLAMGMLISRRKTKTVIKQRAVAKTAVKVEKTQALVAPNTVAAKETAPELPREAIARFEKEDHPGVNLEEQCRKVLSDNTHLLNIAHLNVHPAARAPFKTTVNAPADKVTEAIQHMLKGTIAMANTKGAKISHMEWNCKEASGRVFLEFVLHGFECDYKGLYLNTLIEKEGSAPAYFGRSEMALDGHLPSVIFKSGKGRTTVSLGLDSHATSLTH